MSQISLDGSKTGRYVSRRAFLLFMVLQIVYSFFGAIFFLYYLQVLTGIIYLTLHSTFYFLLGRESFKGGIGCSSYFKGLHVPWGWWQTQSLPTSFFTEDFFENKKFLALMKKTIPTENKKCSFKHELGEAKLDETDRPIYGCISKICLFSISWNIVLK